MIGGAGGSGTRVVAQILLELGYYLGYDLNAANDNLWFTLLFKRPQWYTRNCGSNSVIYHSLATFKKIMQREPGLATRDVVVVAEAAIEMMLRGGHDRRGYGKGTWSLKRIAKMIAAQRIDLRVYSGWGWKEPNSYIYLDFLIRYFQDLRYVHVVRHGLDMAFSSNQNQLYEWGSVLFGIGIPSDPERLPKASLQYWIESNRRAAALAQQLGDRFLMVNFDRLCTNPRSEIETLLQFLECDRTIVDVGRLTALINPPTSIGRYKKHDLSLFTSEEIAAVRQFGFTVDIDRCGASQLGG